MTIINTKFAEIWGAVLNNVEKVLNDKTVFSNFFSNTQIVSIEGDTITIVAENSFAATVIKNKYLEMIQEQLVEITQSNFKCVICDRASYEAQHKLNDILPTSIEKPFVSNLNPKYTFENFVTGQSNRESCTAAASTAIDPGHFFNPLFLYGRSGLGKTHLLHAIGNYIKNKNSSMKVLYMTVDDFFEEYVKAIKDKEIEALKDKYRQIDVLLLDDIQFLASKEKTKEVFFNIFNILFNAGKQIVITSDRHPQELKSLEDRLVGRFSSGLSIEIKDLEYDTAFRILKKKIETMNINGGNIDDEVLEFIAQNYSSDVRQLEGALNKLLFYAINFKQQDEINMTTALETFKSFSKNKEKNKLDCDLIQLVVAEYYNISVSQLKGKLRNTNIVLARQIAMYLCRTMLDCSFKKIGEEFGGKDHSTVIASISKVEKMLKENSDYLIAINEIKEIIKKH